MFCDCYNLFLFFWLTDWSVNSLWQTFIPDDWFVLFSVWRTVRFSDSLVNFIFCLFSLFCYFSICYFCWPKRRFVSEMSVIFHAIFYILFVFIFWFSFYKMISQFYTLNSPFGIWIIVSSCSLFKVFFVKIKLKRIPKGS